MSFDRLQYESKLHWKTIFLLPMLLIALFGFFILLQSAMHENTARTFLVALEAFLPLAAGIMAGTTVAKDPAIELHMTLPYPYRRTSLLRLFMIIAITGCICGLSICILTALKFWFLPKYILTWFPLFQWLIVQLIWLAPLLWFVALGLCLTLLTRSSAASSGILAGVWLIELMLWDPFLHNAWLRAMYVFATTMWIYQGDSVSLPAWFFNSVWVSSRIELLGTAFLLFLLGWLLLRNTESLLKGATIE